MKPEASAVALEAVSLPSPTAAGVASEYSQDDLRDLLEPEEPQSKKSRTYTEASEVTARLAQPDVMVWNPVIMQYVSAARLGSETSAEDWRD
jgi:cell division septation protein DedD